MQRLRLASETVAQTSERQGHTATAVTVLERLGPMVFQPPQTAQDVLRFTFLPYWLECPTRSGYVTISSPGRASTAGQRWSADADAGAR